MSETSTISSRIARQLTLRRLELTALSTTALAFVLTVALIETTAVHEANPITAALADHVGWAGAGVIGIGYTAGAFALFRRTWSYRYRGVRVAHVGAVLVAAPGVADLAVNVVRLAQVGLPSLALEAIVATSAPVVLATVVAVGHPAAPRVREAVSKASIARAGRRTVPAVVAVLVVTSMFVGVVVIGTQPVDPDTSGTVEATSHETGIVLSTSDDNTLEASDPETGNTIWSYTFSSSVYDVHKGPNGKYVYAHDNSDDADMHRIYAANGTLDKTIPLATTTASYATGSIVSPDGGTVYHNNFNDDNISAVDVGTGAVDWEVSITGSSMDEFAISSDGGTLYVGGNHGSNDQGRVTAIDSSTGDVLWTTLYVDSVNDIALSPDESKVYVEVAGDSGNGETVATWVSNQSTQWIYTVDNYGTHDLTVSPNGKTVYVTNTESNDRHIQAEALDAETGNLQWRTELSTAIDEGHAIYASDDGKKVFYGIGTGEVGALDSSDGSLLWSDTSQTGNINHIVSMNTDVKLLSSLSTTNTGSTSTELNWESNHDGQTNVEYKPSDSSTWKTYSTVSGTTTSETITGLKNGEKYDVRVIVDGGTTNSTTSATTTLPADDQPVLSTPSEGQITVDRETVITNYGEVEVQYRETNTSTWTTHTTVPYDFTTIDIENLSDEEEYTVRLQTQTEHTTGSWTDLVSTGTLT
ncbi:PQQ-binding-like beta-propeller repeat protein, partial [Halolamina sp. R1-12]